MPAPSLRSSGSWTRSGSRASSSRPLHRKVWGSPSWTGCAGRPLDYGRRIIVYTVIVVTGVDTPVAPRPDAQRRRPSMKRFLALACLVALALAPVLLVTDAWARAGGGSSGGSRGSRSYSSPAKPAPSPMTPSQPVSPASPAPQRPGWGGGLMGGLAGFALGGLLGSMLFGHGMGGGLGGGLGLLEMLLIGC